MKTRTVEYAATDPATREPVRWFYEIVDAPVSFDVGEGHVELGGLLVAMKNGECFQVFGEGMGPTFDGLWDGCTYHLVVRSWQ